jgi:hypothetical protein
MPVLLLGNEPDYVARPDFLDWAAFALTRPRPVVTSNVCPSGCVCHAVRAPGSKVTVAPPTRAPSLPLNGASIRTVPVNHSCGPLADVWEPTRLISIASFLCTIREDRWGARLSTIIPMPADQNPCAQSGRPMDMMVHG